jgi:hypothetical protein
MELIDPEPPPWNPSRAKKKWKILNSISLCGLCDLRGANLRFVTNPPETVRIREFATWPSFRSTGNRVAFADLTSGRQKPIALIAALLFSFPAVISNFDRSY